MKGIVIPAYIPTWTQEGKDAYQRILDAGAIMKNTKMFVVINPNSGPLTNDKHAAFRNEFIDKLHALGHYALGYVSTVYSRRDPALIKADVALYMQQNKVDGIFFDEASTLLDDRSALMDFVPVTKWTVFNFGVMVTNDDSYHKVIHVTSETYAAKFLERVVQPYEKHDAVLLHTADSKIPYDTYLQHGNPEYLFVTYRSYDDKSVDTWGTVPPDFVHHAKIVEATNVPPPPPVDRTTKIRELCDKLNLLVLEVKKEFEFQLDQLHKVVGEYELDVDQTLEELINVVRQ